jgi:hypothetical protein
MQSQRWWSGLWTTMAVCTALQVGSGRAAAQQALEAPWQQTDIGNVGLAGSATVGPDGDLFINGAGSDIWGTADSFYFVYQPLWDGEIASNSPSLQNTNPFAKIGIMIRDSLDPGSPHVILDVKPDGSVEFMTRSTPNGPTTFISGTGPSSHSWALHLVRSNGVIMASICFAATCQALGSTSFASGPALAGAAITSHDPSVLNHGVFAASPPYVLTVPQPWVSFDVGDVGLTGSAYFQNSTFTVAGAGADIWGASDAYHFVNSGLNGDGEIIARVTSEQAVNTYAKAGIVMTDGPDGTATTVILDVRPNGDIEFMARPTQNGQMAFLAGDTSAFPVWLKLVRSGDQFTGYTSPDPNNNWEMVGGTQVSMQPSALAGLAVTSHDTSALNTSTFDHVAVVSGNFYTDLDIGDVGAAGSFTDDGGGHYFINGAGGDIWGTEDAFNFWYADDVGDGYVSTRVMAIQDTNPFAKAGVMIRESTDPSSAHVILDARPDGEIEFMTRGATGESTTFIAGASATFPVYLILTQTGSTITAAMSQDASTWTTIGSTSVNFTPLLQGLVVTSHERGVLANGYFNVAAGLATLPPGKGRLD